MDELRRGGLAEADSVATLEALQRGRVDVLVMAEGYEPPAGWACRNCRNVERADHPPAACPVCGDCAVREADLKAEIVRLAELHDVEVEILRESDALIGIGGIGCLLKYRRSGQFCLGQRSVSDRGQDGSTDHERPAFGVLGNPRVWRW